MLLCLSFEYTNIFFFYKILKNTEVAAPQITEMTMSVANRWDT